MKLGGLYWRGLWLGWLVVGVAACSVSRQDAPLFRSPPRYTGTIAQPSPGRILRHRFVQIDMTQLTTNRSGAEDKKRLVLNLFEDVVVEVVFEKREGFTDRNFVWFGHVEGNPEAKVTFAIEDGMLAGSVRLGQAFYQVRSAGGEVYGIYQIDPAAFPPESAPRKSESRPQSWPRPPAERDA